jgi:hypothetical protein
VAPASSHFDPLVWFEPPPGERAGPKENRRETESGDTVMKGAFIDALVKFTARGEFSGGGIVLPTSRVDGRELAHVICALVALREQSRSRR